MTNQIEIRPMWASGPLRQYAAIRPASNWVPYDGGGYVGSYVCSACRKLTAGVYETPEGWMCAEHRTNAKFQRLSGKKCFYSIAA